MHFSKFFVISILFTIQLFAHDASMDLFMNHGSVMMMIDPHSGEIAFANKQASKFYQMPLEELLTKNIKDINQLSSLEVEKEMNSAKCINRNYFLFKHRIGTDEIKDVEVYSYPVIFDNRQLLFSVIVDVTDRLKAEEKVRAYELKSKQRFHFVIYLVVSFSIVTSILSISIYLKNKKMRYLTDYDPLTGVLNRRSLVAIYNKFQHKKRFPIAVFMIDVNNLKFINDTFGHITGDKMIIEVSNMLQSLNKVKTVVSRVSGDEFVMMVPNATDDLVADYVKFITSHQIVIEGVNFNSSVGVHMVHNKILPYEFAFTKAEEKMYTQKVLNKERLNVAIENSLMSRATAAVGVNSELNYVAEISGLIADRAGLSFHDVAYIKEAAKLQVIGYATISESLISDCPDFTGHENIWYRRHPETGYKILTTLGKSNTVSTAVFYHHENYDGSGFPKSIKGEDIPLASRIVSLANGIYKTMRATGTNVYDCSIFEMIKEDSGTIYDPHLVELVDSEQFSIELV